MWPKLSQINDKIYTKIINRNNYEVSQLNVWVRLFSGVGDGLIMVSNPDTKLFAAAGEGGIYGFQGDSEVGGYSGALGKNWKGGIVNPSVGRSLRPSPIVTSMEFEEGEDQISRSGKISITAFSLEQMQAIQKYFMEPGYNVFVEWGWNTADGAFGLIDTSNINNIASLASNGNLTQSGIASKHTKTNGDYDNFLGFIVGGSVSNDGENFSITVEMRGTPELPTYLQNQNIVFNATNTTVTKVEGSQPYTKADLTKIGGAGEEASVALHRRFAAMVLGLPAQRQTAAVKALKSKFTLNDFVNLDGVIESNINSYLQGTFWERVWSAITPGSDIDMVEVENFQVEKEKLFSKHKYVRFERMIDVINASGLGSYNVGDKALTTSIDISDTKIGAFPLIYSTKPESLLIPGNLPNFEKYYLSTDNVNYSTVIDNPINNSIGGISFVGTSESTTGHIEQSGYWGYLKNLYVNLDMVHQKLLGKNKNFREVLYDILNEMSSAVNSFWDFQITESVKGDSIIFTVSDRNWVGQSPGKPKEFYHNGENCRFLDSSLSIDIPGEMANQIINRRLGVASQTDAPIIKVQGTFFAKGADKFMKSVTLNGKTAATSDEPDPDSVEGKEAQKEDNKAQLEDIEAGLKIGRTERVVGGYSTHYVNSAGDEVYYTFTTTGRGSSTTPPIAANTPSGNKWKSLKDDNITLENEIKETKESNLSANIGKLDVLPNPSVVTEMDITDELITQQGEGAETNFRDNFRIYTFKDTNLFDYLKNLKILGSSGRLSHPLPIKYSFTIFGTSGIRRGDMFNIVGIPEKYRKSGLFQVNAVSHTIEGMSWKTNVEGLYRQSQ